MIVEFSVANYLSFKESVTLSMVSSTNREFSNTHVFQTDNEMKLLKSAAIYGANGSGKSNICKALSFMLNFIRTSSKETQVGEKIDVSPFKLSTETDQKPSSFELVFILDKVMYRYGFEVDSDQVVAEWLFGTTKNKEIKLFFRQGDQFDVTKNFKEGFDWENKTRRNALFLSVIAQFKGEISARIVEWLNKNVNVISGLRGDYHAFSKKMIKDPEFKNLYAKCLKAADIGIEDLLVLEQELNIEELPEEIRVLVSKNKVVYDSTVVKMLHKKYDAEGNVVSLEKFDLDDDESEGTRKLFSVLGPILDTLKSGKVLVVDELDSSLHPLITKDLVKFFHSTETNPNNAQLIFNTHDTNMLNNKIFRRDQIWFTEKDTYGASHLYSLVEYSNNSKVRKDEASIHTQMRPM